MTSWKTFALLGVLALPLATSCSDMFGGKKKDKTEESESDRGDEKADKKKKTAKAKDSGKDVSLPTPAGSAIVDAIGTSTVDVKQFPASVEFERAPEVTVKGSTALGCETRMVREWLRVSCRGKNDSGGTPVLVRIGRGGGPDVHVFSVSGLTSLVMPYVEGVDTTAIFSWTNKSHRLVVRWPKGAPMPTVLATFEGAASPLDGATHTNEAVGKRLCDCQNKVRRGSCTEQESGNAFCDATYADCQALVECSRGEPGRMPKCPAGTKPYAMNTCAPSCEGGKVCPGGLDCDKANGICL